MKFIVYIFIVVLKISLNTYLLFGLYLNKLKVLSKPINTNIIDKYELNLVLKIDNLKKDLVKFFDSKNFDFLQNDRISEYVIEEAIKQLEDIKFKANQDKFNIINKNKNYITNIVKTYYDNFLKIYLNNEDLLTKVKNIISYISILLFINGSEFLTTIKISNKNKKNINKSKIKNPVIN